MIRGPDCIKRWPTALGPAKDQLGRLHPGGPTFIHVRQHLDVTCLSHQGSHVLGHCEGHTRTSNHGCGSGSGHGGHATQQGETQYNTSSKRQYITQCSSHATQLHQLTDDCFFLKREWGRQKIREGTYRWSAGAADAVRAAADAPTAAVAAAVGEVPPVGAATGDAKPPGEPTATRGSGANRPSSLSLLPIEWSKTPWKCHETEQH